MIYLNAAGHGLPSSGVRQRMIAYLTREDEIGVAEAEAEVADELTELRPRLARLVGAAPHDLAYLDWATLAWNAAVFSLPLEGRRVLVAPGEWSSNVALLQRLGAHIEVMAVDGRGRLDVAEIAARIDEDLAGIFMPMVSSLTGDVFPAAEIGRLARPAGCLFVVDASQALGQMTVSMTALGCDILAAPTRKWMRGPKGTGLLAVRQSALGHMLPSRVADDGRLTWANGVGEDVANATRFEKMGFNVALRLGLSTALATYEDDPFSAHDGVMRLARHVRARAAELGLEPAGVEQEPSAITTLRGPSDVIGAAFEAAKAQEFVIKSPTPDCEPLRPQETVQGGFLRISPHVYNSAQEIDALFDVLRRSI